MQKRNCISSLVCAAVFAFFLIQCASLSASAAYWPRIICIVGLSLSVLEIVLEGIKWSKAAAKQEKLWPLSAAQTKRSLSLLGILVLWILGLNTVGFLVSSVLALCAIALVFEPIRDKKHIILDIIVCAVFGVVFYFTFQLLGIHFPDALLI